MGFPFLLQKKGDGMSNLRTNYKDDVFTGKRKYSEIDNGDGTISFDDVTNYAQVGDTYGAAQINETNDVINNLDSKAYKNTDSAETTIADNDYFPFYDASASASRKTLWSNIKTILTNVFAIKTHSSSATTYGPGSETLYGHVKLSDSYQSSAGAAASAIAASSKAVYDSYIANKNSITTLNGTVVANKTTETEHYNYLYSNKAFNYHASPSVTYGVGTSNDFGHLKISDGAYEGNAAAGVAASSDLVGVVNDKVDNVNNKVGDIQNELTANNNRIYMDYKNGKYGINTSANRGADTFIPFSSYEIEGTPILNEIWFDAGEHTFSFSAEAQSYYLVTVGGSCSDGIAEFRSITGVTSTLMSISGTLFSGFMNTYIVYTQNASTVNVTTYVNDDANNRGIGCTVVKFK